MSGEFGNYTPETRPHKERKLREMWKPNAKEQEWISSLHSEYIELTEKV